MGPGSRRWRRTAGRDDVAGDAVHFDHTAAVDDRGLDTKAFQVLWNRHHPADQITADGAYGPMTETRLRQSPATGFAIGPTCAGHDLVASVVSVDGPDRVAPGTVAHYTIIIKNTGVANWPATTKFDLDDGGESFGTIKLALRVALDGATNPSTDAGDVTGGGCSAGGGTGPIALALPALLLARRRRRNRPGN